MKRQATFLAAVAALTVSAWTAVPIPAEPEPSVEASPTPTPSPSRAKQRWPVTYARSRLCLVRVADVLRMRSCRLAVP
jgi:hypothetical protein